MVDEDLATRRESDHLGLLHGLTLAAAGAAGKTRKGCTQPIKAPTATAEADTRGFGVASDVR
jgi:hypothetical protein